jgi:hypothetical protein
MDDKENMTPKKILTLPSGARLNEGVQAVTIVPFIEDFESGDAIALENVKGELLGEGTVDTVLVETFAHLQNSHLKNNSHPEMTTWAGAFNTLMSLDPQFQQTDKVTVVSYTVTKLEVEDLSPDASFFREEYKAEFIQEEN